MIQRSILVLLEKMGKVFILLKDGVRKIDGGWEICNNQLKIFEEGYRNFDLKSLTEEERQQMRYGQKSFLSLQQKAENFWILEARFREDREENFSSIRISEVS